MHGLSGDVDVFRVAEGEDGPGDVLARAHGAGTIGLAQVGVGLASPTLGLDPGCDCADLSGDGNVDLEDVALLQNAFTGLAN